jgi:phage FluMu protein gp41
MINEICNYFGVPTVDSRLMGMTIWNRNKYLISDSTHLNNVGMDLLFRQIDDTLNSTKVSGGVSKTTVETMISDAVAELESKINLNQDALYSMVVGGVE